MVEPEESDESDDNDKIDCELTKAESPKPKRKARKATVRTLVPPLTKRTRRSATQNSNPSKKSRGKRKSSEIPGKSTSREVDKIRKNKSAILSSGQQVTNKLPSTTRLTTDNVCYFNPYYGFDVMLLPRFKGRPGGNQAGDQQLSNKTVPHASAENPVSATAQPHVCFSFVEIRLNALYRFSDLTLQSVPVKIAVSTPRTRSENDKKVDTALHDKLNRVQQVPQDPGNSVPSKTTTIQNLRDQMWFLFSRPIFPCHVDSSGMHNFSLRHITEDFILD